MKSFYLCAALALLPLLQAQDDADFQKEMKVIDEHAGVLRKMPARTVPEAAERADKIAALYGNMKTFWAKRNVSDAVKFSEDGQTAAVQLASAAKAADGEKAEAAFKALSGTCRGCHTAHREKLPDGTYKIK